jgi:hypothetical protein
MVYHAICQSIISYGILLWGSATNWTLVFKWQKKAIRAMMGKPPWESCRGHFRKFNILTVPCCFMYHSLLYVKTHLQDYKDGTMIHNYETRNNALIIPPKVRLVSSSSMFDIQGIKYYNLLPNAVKMSSTTKFKQIIKKELISCEGYNWQEIEDYIRKMR